MSEAHTRAISFYLDNLFFGGAFTPSCRVFARIDGTLSWSETHQEGGLTVTNERYGNVTRLAFYDAAAGAYRQTAIFGTYTNKNTAVGENSPERSHTNEYTITLDPLDPTRGVQRRVSSTTGYPESPDRRTQDPSYDGLPLLAGGIGWQISRSAEITTAEIEGHLQEREFSPSTGFRYGNSSPELRVVSGGIGGSMYGYAIMQIEQRFQFLPIPVGSLAAVPYLKISAKSADTEGWTTPTYYVWEASSLDEQSEFVTPWFGNELFGHEWHLFNGWRVLLDFTNFFYTWTHGQKFKIPPVPF